MALMTPQAVSSVITPTFSAPTTSDTVTPDQGLLLYVKVGATSTTITLVVPGNQPYSGSAKTDVQVATVTNTERVFNLSNSELVDPSTGLINITYSQVANVTAALIKH